MHRPTIHTTLILAAALAVASPAAPGDFRPSETSSQATWFAHVNFVSLRSSEIGKQLIGELDGEARRQLRKFKGTVGFHPIDDVESATFYGASSDPEAAVALIRGTFDTRQLIAIAEEADHYSPLAHGSATIHSWKDSQRTIYATIANDRLVIISPKLDLLRTATDVVIADGPALDTGDIFGHRPTGESPIIIASAKLSALGDLNIDSALVRKIKSVYLSAGEAGGQLLAFAALETADPRSAKLVDQMLHGVLALAEASEQVPQEFIDAFKTKLDESSLHLTVSLPVQKFRSLVAKLEEAAGGLK